MTNWQLHVRGRYDRSKTHYLIEEIIGIEFDVHMPASVAFINPDFVKNESNEESARSGTGGTDWQSSDEEFVVDDDQSASDQNETLVLEDDLSWIRFKKTCEVYKQERVKDTNKLIIDKFAEKKAGREVSTDEPYQGGTLSSADVGGKQDVTDREMQFVSRFQSFDHMLQVLQVKHQCSILNQQTLPLPKVGRSVQHQLSDGSPRAIKAIRLRHKSVEVILLEVDTSDGIKMLSTKMIFGSDDRDWDEQYAQIRKGVVSKSISWPNKFLDEVYGEGYHIGINHPKHQGAEAGNIPLESIESWALRILQGL
ncbi:MAG: Tn7-like element transposition protein TnsE [Shewanella sp.]